MLKKYIKAYVWLFGLVLAIVAFLKLFPPSTYKPYDIQYFLLYFFIGASIWLLFHERKTIH